MTYSLIFFVINYLLFARAEKIVSHHYINDHLNRSNVNLNLTDDNIIIKTGFNTFVPFSMFKVGKLNLSTPIISNETVHLNNQYKSSLYSFNFNIEETEVKNFKIYLTQVHGNNRADHADDGIGLAYKFDDESFSYIHYLYNNKFIEHLQFAFEHDDQNRIGMIHFGGIPSKEYLSMPYKGVLKVNDQFGTWNTKLTGVQFEQDFYRFNNYAIIHSAFYDIFWSNALNDLMINKIFKNEIERGECFKREYFEYSFVQCENSSLPIFEENVKFKFGNMITTVSIKQLFREQSNHWESIINANPYMLYDDAVIMGVRFMQLFNLSVFDYEKKEMRFYSDTTEIEMNDTMPSVNAGTNKILCIFLMVICLANIALFVLHLKVKDEDL